jgi:hypothetical protein
MTQDSGPQQPGQYGQPPYGQAPHEQAPYNPAPYGQAPYGQPPYGYGYPPPRRTNGLAIASMVLGIVWLYWIGSILALVFGYIARKQIRERGESGDGMAIAGIVLGWVGIAAIGLVVVVGFASYSSV